MNARDIKSGLAPIGCDTPRILVLGTLPGDESIRQQQYYAHPQNQFWRILAMVYDEPVCTAYDARLSLARRHGIAIWDVLERAVRVGSLDTAIQDPVLNSFDPLFERCPLIEAIGFNGQKSSALFKRHIIPQLNDRLHGIRMEVLPSTSPAAARLPFEEKAARWRAFLKG